MENDWTLHISKETQLWVRRNCLHHWDIKESICLFKAQGLYSVVVELNGPVFAGKLHGPLLYLTLEEAKKAAEVIIGQIQDLRAVEVAV